ncbi:hypothetical protein QR680_018328 [Steinernema hermaphroditum]|uniref:Uncharacterized protein n=1 Tax=Steinernema hermaphroditum TaxID=289476 RepID=A0AA39HJY9_9BILA|nr:hypothetical protein QR680_018328 [Steinernema hermaphroditum]
MDDDDRRTGSEAESSMSFEKIADFFSDQASDHWDANHVLFNNGKIWMWNRKYVNQHCYNWGHHVSFDGGLFTVFDTATNKWESPAPFPSICRAQNMEEALFTLKGRIYLLLYTHFGGVHFGKVFEWDEDERHFKEHSIVEADEGSSIYSADGDSSKHHVILADSDDGHSKYIVTFVDRTIRVHALTIDQDEKRCTVKKVAEVPDNLNFRRVQPCQAAFHNGKVFIMGGVHGCGFMFESGFVIRVDVNDGTSESIEVIDPNDSINPNTPKPPFSFTGARCTTVIGGAWMHISGACLQGMCNSTFNGEVWALVGLDSPKPQWQRLDFDIPDNGANSILVTDPAVPTIYGGSPSAGLLRATLN